MSQVKNALPNPVRMICLTETAGASSFVDNTVLDFQFIILLEILALWVFLGADAQLLGTSLAGVRRSLSMYLNHYLLLTI